jgi:HME family heavy-metal exporter
MFDFIIHAALKQRLIVICVSLLLIIYGALTLRQMPVDVFPDLNKPTVTLMTEPAAWRRKKSSNWSPSRSNPA